MTFHVVFTVKLHNIHKKEENDQKSATEETNSRGGQTNIIKFKKLGGKRKETFLITWYPDLNLDGLTGFIDP